MQNEKSILKQNLCSSRIFLNLFGLNLEEKIDSNDIRIFDTNNYVVGALYLDKETVKIKCITSLGNLNAFYHISKLDGFEDLEYGGVFLDFSNNINFEVKGLLNFIGNMQIALSMDTHFGNNYSISSVIKYIDKYENLVKISFMTDGKPFRYEARKEGFRELLEVNPWNNFDSFMYHEIRKGEYDNNHHCFPYENVKYITHNGFNDMKHLQVFSHVIKDFNIIEYDNKLESVECNDLITFTIKKGLLMHKIDADFSKKIVELINLFKRGNVSFLNNLIDVVFSKVSQEERKALFGVDIETNYHTNNLLDLFAFEKGKNKFLLK